MQLIRAILMFHAKLNDFVLEHLNNRTLINPPPKHLSLHYYSGCLGMDYCPRIIGYLFFHFLLIAPPLPLPYRIRFYTHDVYSIDLFFTFLGLVKPNSLPKKDSSPTVHTPFTRSNKQFTENLRILLKKII